MFLHFNDYALSLPSEHSLLDDAIVIIFLKIKD